MIRRPPRSTLFPSTTLSRSLDETADGVVPEFEGAPGHPLVLTARAARAVLDDRDSPHLEAAQKKLRIARVKTKDPAVVVEDRKSTRLNSSHSQISYAVFCLK